jgi:hypothetical protein
MARPKTNQRSLPIADSRGRIRPYVGVRMDGRKARFTVGDSRTSRAEMQRRLDLIRMLYEKQCERTNINYWHGWTYRVALKIAAGEVITDECIGCNPAATVGVVVQLRAWGIPVTVGNPIAYAEGLAIHQEQITTLVQKLVAEEVTKLRRVRGAVADTATLPDDPLAMAETATLHQALEARRNYLTDTGKKDGQGSLVARVRKCQDRLRYLKQHHADMPLWKLDLPTIDKMAAYWRNRPITKKGNRCSREHATDMLKEWWRFLGWLEDQPNFRWQKPKGTDKISRSPAKLPEDNTSEAFQTTTKKTYTPEQLATIAKYTDDFGKALIALCVNCAFGAAEVGQWPTQKFLLHTAHPHADKLDIKTTKNDSWIVGPRPKTGVYGEHWLWPQVARAVFPFLDGRAVLTVDRNGNSWYKTHKSNPQTPFFDWWNKLLDVVQAEEKKKHNIEFPRLPFGSLRDTLPNILRARYAEEIASMALQHGQTGDDDLLRCYANTPFAKLFRATQELAEYYKPFLDAIS